MSNQKALLHYKNDIVFKYIFGRHSHESTLLRQFLIESFLPVSLDNYEVTNPDMPTYYKGDKDVIFDIFLKEHVIIEMQNTTLSHFLEYRFQYYNYREVVTQLMEGEKNYSLLQKSYILVFVNDTNPQHELEKIITLKDQHFHETITGLIEIHIVFIKEIERIVKEKEVLEEKEAMIYLLHQRTIENIKYHNEKGMIEMAKQLFNEFLDNPILLKAGLTRIEAENLAKMKEYMDREEGMKTGEFNALVYSLSCQIQSKYGKQATWLQECTIDKLKQLVHLIVSDMSYEEFYEIGTH